MALTVDTLSDIQSEAGVIATLFAHPEYVMHTDWLKARHFREVENGCIYWAITELYKAGIDNIDVVNITNMLNSNKAVRKTIESYNISDMNEFIEISRYAARNTLEEYKLMAKTVVTFAYRRDLNAISREIQSYCFNDSWDLSKINSAVNERMNKLTQEYLTTEEIVSFGDKIDDLWDQICARRSEDGIYGIPSKFRLLNEYFTYEAGELVLLKARMKRGKSAIFLNEAIHKLKSGVPTLYIDTEMQDRLFYERMLANLSGVSVKNIKTGRYSAEDEQRLRDANNWIKSAPFVHIYMPQTSDDEIYAIHKILKYKMDLQFSIYDYIKSDVMSTSDNYNILGAKTDFLKNRIAGELNIAVLAGAQLNRNMEVADSDKISRYVSTSILWREKTSEEIARDGIDCGNFALNIDLNRNGQQMAEEEYIDMKFDGDHMRIIEAKQHGNIDKPF